MLLLWFFLTIREIIFDFDLHDTLSQPEITYKNITVTREKLQAKHETYWIYGYAILSTMGVSVFGLLYIVYYILYFLSGKDGDYDQNLQIVTWIQITYAIYDYSILICAGSVLNKLRYWQLWTGNDYELNFTYFLYFIFFSKPASLAEYLKRRIILGTLSIFRTAVVSTVKIMDIFEKLSHRIAFAPVWTLVITILTLRIVSSSMVFHYVQRQFTSRGDFSLGYDQEMAIALAALSLIAGSNTWGILTLFFSSLSGFRLLRGLSHLPLIALVIDSFSFATMSILSVRVDNWNIYFTFAFISVSVSFAVNLIGCNLLYLIINPLAPSRKASSIFDEDDEDNSDSQHNNPHRTTCCCLLFSSLGILMVGIVTLSIGKYWQTKWPSTYYLALGIPLVALGFILSFFFHLLCVFEQGKKKDRNSKLKI